MWMRRTRRAMAGAGGAGVLLVMLAAHAGAGVGAVDVIRQQVSFEEDHSVTVDSTVEYILQFIPSGEQAQWPVRLRVSASGGDTSRPVLLTARQTTGAQTWQLPYRAADAPGAGAGAGGDLLFEMQRTLCYDPEQSGSSASGQFTLHVSTAGAAVTVAARADPARDWLLRAQGGAEVSITLTAPRALYYRFAPGEERVRLVAESADDVCAVVGVHNYTCPVAELADTITSAGLHMTVQRSGGVQLSRRQFPSGFFVVALVKASDVDCTGEQEEHPDWLWGAALGAGGDVSTAAPRAAGGGRAKALTFTVKAALSRAQYAAAVAATTLGFLLLYAAFAALVWAQRFDAVRRHVGPKAATAQPDADGGETMVDGTTRTRTRRRRRDSDATFDSVDDDSDSEEEEDSPAPRASPGTPPTARAAAVNVAYSAERVDEGDVTTNDDNTDDVTGTDAMTNHVQNRNENGSNIIDGIRNGHDVVAGNDVGGGTYSPAAEGGAGRGGGAPGGSAPGGGAPGGSAPGVSAPGGGGRAQAEVRAAPFGLPARLRVAALARRRDRTLRARSDRYLHTLYTVALFYTLPVVQFVAAFQIVLNVSGSLDLCYYNFLCAHPLGALSDFNHVFSNAGYLLLGALFLLQGYGLPAHYGLLSSLGAGMMVVAMLSASYHICPNALNFQFDVAFMYVLAALAMVKMYQARHPDINARAHHTFAALALLIALVVWGVLGGGALFWGVCTALHVFAVLLLSLRIYYVGQFTLDGSGLAEAARGLARPLPLYAPRLVMLLIANAVNWAFALYGLITMPADFATHLLMVLLMNTLLYMVFYIVMKLVCGERLRWYAWGFLGAAAAAWAPALYLFLAGSTSWAATPAHSRHLNHECRLLHFYDNHDLWHMLSALALYLSFNAMLTWDDGLSAVKRSEIAVF